MQVDIDLLENYWNFYIIDNGSYPEYNHTELFLNFVLVW